MTQMLRPDDSAAADHSGCCKKRADIAVRPVNQNGVSVDDQPSVNSGNRTISPPRRADS
jgi:hypothetical protein